MVNERQTHSPLFSGLIKTPKIRALIKCLKELKELEKRIVKIEKQVFPITGKGGKDG